MEVDMVENNKDKNDQHDSKSIFEKKFPKKTGIMTEIEENEKWENVRQAKYRKRETRYKKLHLVQ